MIRVLLDTNILRYYGDKSDSRTKRNYEHIQAFWDDIVRNPENYSLCIAEETKREIDVQMPIIERTSQKVAKSIKELLLDLEIVPTIYNDAMEHRVRIVASHLKTSYKIMAPNNKEMNYPKVSDARILLTAFQHDLRIVTKDIQDFMIYPCMDGVLWNPATNTEVVLSDDDYKKIESDTELIRLLHDLAMIKTS